MVTRFAPSLTGYLHLGHVLHMLFVWGFAGKTGAKVLCRIEDHDWSRARPEYEAAIFETMQWLGFIPDLGILSADEKPSEFRQSACSAYYEAVLQTLEKRGLVYGCQCSRKEIQQAMTVGTVSPQVGQGIPPAPPSELCYSGTCSEKGLPLEGNTVRFRTLEGKVSFMDLKLGEQRQTPKAQCGDFSLRDRNGQWTYQFACVCDDIRQGVDLVIRGEDILVSTGRQIQLFQTLEAAAPHYLHHPLIYSGAGKKLSKRQRAESITSMREAGRTAEEVIGQALYQAGFTAAPQPILLPAALQKYII